VHEFHLQMPHSLCKYHNGKGVNTLRIALMEAFYHRLTAFSIRLDDEHLRASPIETLLSSGTIRPGLGARMKQEVLEMLKSIFGTTTKKSGTVAKAVMGAVGVALASMALPAEAQELETLDPDVAFDTPVAADVRDAVVSDAVATVADTGVVDGDLGDPSFRTAPALAPVSGKTGSSITPRSREPAQPEFDERFTEFENGPAALEGASDWGSNTAAVAGEPVPQWNDPAEDQAITNAPEQSGTYGEDDLIGAAEGVFGKGAQGLAGLIEDLLRKQGEPNGYIVGREAGGAFIFGARYGSGTLHHKVEGERKVYWTGPSLGFDAGANAGNTFVLVYNLFDSEDIFRRYPSGEGQAYLVGGMHASYMRRGDVVLIPIRVGAGLRLGVNAGYMRFSKKHRWLPF